MAKTPQAPEVSAGSTGSVQGSVGAQGTGSGSGQGSSQRYWGEAMTKPQRYLIRMGVFLTIALVAMFPLYPRLADAFQTSMVLNGMILAVFIIGILYIFRQVWTLNAEVTWIETYRRGQPGLSITQPRLLSAMATMLGERGGRLSLSPVATRSLIDSIGARLDEQREISRYLIGLLVFLGLLGTFWGLLQTVSSVAESISGLQVGGGISAEEVFASLQTSLEGPLGGMGTAFSSSLFGLGGSLILGFLELQAGQAQNRFANELEEWLSTLTRISAGAGAASDGDPASPAYMGALIEQLAENLQKLEKSVSRSEENRSSANANFVALVDRLGTLTDQMKTEQVLMVKLAESQMEMQPVFARLADSIQTLSQGGQEEALRTSLRSIEAYLARMYEDAQTGRSELSDDIRSEIKLLARTIAALAEDDR